MLVGRTIDPDPEGVLDALPNLLALEEGEAGYGVLCWLGQYHKVEFSHLLCGRVEGDGARRAHPTPSRNAHPEWVVHYEEDSPALRPPKIIKCPPHV